MKIPPAISENPALTIPATSLGLSKRSRLGVLPGFAVAATGAYLPPHTVTNSELAELGCDDEWILQRTGIVERHRAKDGVASSDLAWEASLECLRRASVSPTDVDLVVVATMTPDQPTPSTACMLQRRLGCIAPAFDINAACSGFMYALSCAGNFVHSGLSRRALVVGAEIMSRIANPTDPKTLPLFGDGAGAVLLVPSESRSDRKTGFLAYTLGSEGCGGEILCVPGGGSRSRLTAEKLQMGEQYLRMQGKTVFKWAVRLVEDSVRDVLESAGIRMSEIQHFIFHQANVRILDAVMQNLRLSSDQVTIHVDRVGNTSAASIPLALNQASQNGKLHRGDLVLLCGFGAGLTWGTALLRW